MPPQQPSSPPVAPPQPAPPTAPMPAQPGQAPPAPGYGATPVQPTQPFPQTQPGPGPGAPPPGYGGPPPGFPPGGPGQPPGGPKKSKTGLIVGIIAAVVVVAGLAVGAYFLFFNKTMTNTATETTAQQQTSTTKGSILSSTTKPKSGTSDPLGSLLGGSGSDVEGISASEMSCVESSLQDTLSPTELQDLQGSNTSDATLQKVARSMDSCMSTESQVAFYAKYIKQGLQKSSVTVTDTQAQCMANSLVSDGVSFADFIGGGTTATQQQIADAATSCGVTPG